jgi:GNAT superfamily N-acetyltransferase
MRPIVPDDLDWIVNVHDRLYHEEAGFDAGFAPVVRAAVEGFLAGHDPDREAGWIVERQGAPVGSLFLTADGRAARLRLFLLVPEWRGLGLGREMLGRAREFAAAAGYARLVVATYDRHRAAVRLYEAAGFAAAGSRPATAFGQEMVERRFALPLASGATRR